MITIVRKPALVLCVAVGVSLVSFVSVANASAPCSTDPTSGGQWPRYEHNLANTRTQLEASGLTPSAASGVHPLWSFSTASTGDGTGFNSTPVVGAGCVYVGSAGGTAYALDARTG